MGSWVRERSIGKISSDVLWKMEEKLTVREKRSESCSGIEIVFQFSIEVSTYSFESPASTIVDNGK